MEIRGVSVELAIFRLSRNLFAGKTGPIIELYTERTTLFKNRAFQVKLVQTGEDDKTVTPPCETQADVAAFAADIAKDLMKTAVACVLIYVAADTARKVVVELVSD